MCKQSVPNLTLLHDQSSSDVVGSADDSSVNTTAHASGAATGFCSLDLLHYINNTVIGYLCIMCLQLDYSPTSVMPAGVEATLQQLQLDQADGSNKQETAVSNAQVDQHPQHQQHADQQEQADLQQGTPAALQNTACLAATFAWLDNEQSLVQCSAVCQLWHSVLQAEDIWRRVYLRSLPEPATHEWVGR